MGSAIDFFSGNSDARRLIDFSASIGLIRVPMRVGGTVGDPEQTKACYLSPVPMEELHPYGQNKNMLGPATDPLMYFKMPYYKAPYLVLGALYWDNDVQKLASITLPYFRKISKWIRGTWSKPAGWDFYCSPEALSLFGEGAEPVNEVPRIRLVENGEP